MSNDSLTCEEVIRQLFAYLDRELDDEVSVEIDRHLETCRECFSRAEFERRLRQKVRETGKQQPPERLQRRIRAMLDRY